jgi:nitrite reductase/ring-hydroxylating ferredoxin subunit/uncharacterized membrane protein
VEVDERLDRVAGLVADRVAESRPPALVGPLSGTPLGHPLHPPLTDLPIGFWTSAWVLDLVGGRRRQAAAQTLVGLGVLSAVPTVLTGLSDWSDTVGGTRRVGLVHAGINTVATLAYAASWWARRRGRHGRGVALGIVGATAATLGAYFGGHLVYRTGTGVDVNAFTEPSTDWVTVDEAVAVGPRTGIFFGYAGGDAVLAAMGAGGDAGTAIGDRCSHRGGPLHEGTFDDEGCVTCPWHGSRFRLSDGAVVDGPATSAQPAYEARRSDGTLQVRARP